MKHGKDITFAADLVTTLGPQSKTQILEIPYKAIASAKRSLPPSIPLVKGIMSIRQITFDGVSRTMRKLSCFDCSVDTKCSHNHHIMDLSDWDSGTGIQRLNKKAKFANIKSQTPLSSLLADCSDISGNDEVQNLRPIRNKAVSYKEVFTSSEEHEPDIVKNNSKIEPQPSRSGSTTFKTNQEVVNDVGLGTFVLVRFEGEGKKGVCHQFVGVCQGKNSDEGELEMIFLKSGAPKTKLSLSLTRRTNQLLTQTKL